MIEFDHVMGGEVAQRAVFEPTPERFDRIEHRGIRRQEFKGEALLGSCQQFANGVPPVHCPAIPNHDPAPPVRVEPLIEEDRDLDIVEVRID